jgi:hypothetical protein
MQAGPGFQFGRHVSRGELSPALMSLGAIHRRLCWLPLGAAGSVDGLSLETEPVMDPKRVYDPVFGAALH